jgi:RNA polymerase sigma-70 factor (family 1)
MAAYSAYTDQELVVLLKQGDRKAFQVIYDRYALIIFYKINQMLRDQQASEDILQDLFINLWSKPELVQAGNNLGGYLYVCARNSVLKVLQKEKLKNDYLSSLAEYATEVSYDTLNEINERELGELLKKEIGNLPDKMRIIFEMSRNENLSHAEIAEKLKISEQTVSKQVSNALKILRTKMTVYAPVTLVIIELSKKL